MTWGLKSEGTRTVITQSGVARVAFNEDGSMELLTPAANPTGNDVPTAGQLPFTKAFESAEQVVTSGGLLTVAHDLGVAPKLWNAIIVCKTADQGYAVGDVLEMPTTSAGTSYGAAIVPGVSDFTVRYGNNASSPLFGLNKGTGAVTNLTPANWRLIVRAWA